jgi:hypothetical protein
MALDRYDDGWDGPNDVTPEQHQLQGGSGGDAPTARAEPAEVRTRAECYEALRAADGKPVPASDGQHARSDTRGDNVGWDAVEAGNHPPLDALRVTPPPPDHPHPQAHRRHPARPPRPAPPGHRRPVPGPPRRHLPPRRRHPPAPAPDRAHHPAQHHQAHHPGRPLPLRRRTRHHQASRDQDHMLIICASEEPLRCHTHGFATALNRGATLPAEPYSGPRARTVSMVSASAAVLSSR